MTDTANASWVTPTTESAPRNSRLSPLEIPNKNESLREHRAVSGRGSYPKKLAETPDFDLLNLDEGYLMSTGIGDDDLMLDFFGDNFDGISYYPDHKMREYLADLSRMDDIVRPLQKPKEDLRCSIIGDNFTYSSDLTLPQLLSLIQTKVESAGVESHKMLNPFWVNFQNASLSDLDSIEEMFGIHPLTGHDCVAQDLREKWEDFGEYLFIVVHELTPDNKVSILNLVPLKILLFQNFVLTFHSSDILSVSKTIEIFRDSKKVKSSDRIMHQILKTLIQVLTERVSEIESEVVQIGKDTDDVNFEKMENEEVLGTIRTTNGQLSSLFWMMCIKQQIFLSICSKDRPYIQPKIQMLLRSLLDEIVQLRFELQILRASLETYHSSYLAYTSFQNAQISYDTQKLMKSLSAMATVIVPVMLGISLFGMNISVPGGTTSNLAWFIGIACVSLLASLVLTGYFRAQNYL